MSKQGRYPSLASLFEAVAAEHGDGGLAPDHPLLAGVQLDDDEADVLADVNYALSLAAMSAISHFIEDRAIEQGSTGHVWAGFQKLGRVRPQRERYEALVQRTAGVTIFGEPDRPCPVSGEGVRVVASAAPDVAEHWWVVSDSREFPVCLLAREATTATGARTFRGFWSSNPDLVARVVEVLENIATHASGLGVAA